ncbi:uncharacterized protein LOC143372753 [Andrena cerasifolii]|uniref:uncharacterized protein LOC143372753 n=1 Tax=Andrena cerasifolii TaxID=2819439 RepID=UPI00403841D2
MSKESGKDSSFAGPNNAAIRSSKTKTDSRSAASLIRSAARKAKRAKRAKRLIANPLKQAFCKTWLEEPLFKMWLQETEDPYTVKCTVCSKLLRGTKFTLRKHASTNVHNMNMQQKDNGDAGSAASFIRSPAKKTKRAKRNKKPSKQAFRKTWLEEPQFALWVQETEDPYTVKCTFCSKYLTSGRSHLKQHAKTIVHSTNKQRKTGASISVLSISGTCTGTGVAAVAGPSHAAITSPDSSVAGPSHAAITSPDSSVAGPSDAVIRSSDAETDSSSAASFCPTAKELKQVKTQPLCKVWLKNPQVFKFVTVLKPGQSFRL